MSQVVFLRLVHLYVYHAVHDNCSPLVEYVLKTTAVLVHHASGDIMPMITWSWYNISANMNASQKNRNHAHLLQVVSLLDIQLDSQLLILLHNLAVVLLVSLQSFLLANLQVNLQIQRDDLLVNQHSSLQAAPQLFVMVDIISIIAQMTNIMVMIAQNVPHVKLDITV